MRLPIAELAIGAVMVATLVGLYFAVRLPRVAEYQVAPRPATSRRSLMRVALLFSTLIVALPGIRAGTVAFSRGAPVAVACIAPVRVHLPLAANSASTSSPPASANRPPMTIACTITLQEAAPAMTDLSAVVFDPDSDQLAFTLKAGPGQGSANLSGSLLTYTPPMQYVGIDRIAYSVEDGHGGRAEGEVSISVLAASDSPSIRATITPPPNAAGWNNTNVTVNFSCSDATSGIASCSEPVSVAMEGASQVVLGTAVDRAGNMATLPVSLNIDKSPPDVAISYPADGAAFYVPEVAVAGTASDALSTMARVTCNGVAGSLLGSTFTCNVALREGSNRILVQATDLAGNSTSTQIGVSFVSHPEVQITAPANLSSFNASPIAVSGTVDDPAASVVVNGVPATMSGGTFTANVPLREGNNIITAVARDAAGTVGTSSIRVALDTTPPRVAIDSPPDGFVTNDSSINVAGMINDTVAGTVNGEQAQVTVNGIAAQVANRSFLATAVPLALGANTITASGRDRAGNTFTTSISVLYEALGADPRIRLISGDNQTGSIGAELPAALVVELTDGQGNPAPGRIVIFKVKQNNGTLRSGPTGARSLAVTTDDQGRAQARWTLGTRAGAGNNIVEATAVGFAGVATFMATATPSAADQINVNANNNQIGVVSQALPQPLDVAVTDAGHNRLPHVPVTFTVVEGDGSFGGQPSLTVNTDSDGRALAVFTLGPREGIDNNVVEATFPGNPGFPATFVASGKIATNPANTRVSGVVLDNSSNPIAGVTMHIEGSALTVQTDAQGQFALQPAPVGHIKLIADGGTAQRSGVWPKMEYELVTIAGQNNTVGMPIFILPLDIPNQLCVTETSGGVLTLPQVPGLSLTVLPGSATFPDGSKRGCITVTPVHADKIPMTPNFGQQPRMVVTIQPAGVHFNPPAPLTLPNVDGLQPGEVTEMYSFDHDLGSFVSIGTGTVSEDGTVLRSDPGVGVIKGGWHCGGNPSATGGAQNSYVHIIAAPTTALIGNTFTIEAEGGPVPGNFTSNTNWGSATLVQSNITTVGSGSNQRLKLTATLKADNPNDILITVEYKCRSGRTARTSLTVTVISVQIQEIITPILNVMGEPPNQTFSRTFYRINSPSAGSTVIAPFLAITNPTAQDLIKVRATVKGAPQFDNQIAWDIAPIVPQTGQPSPNSASGAVVNFFPNSNYPLPDYLGNYSGSQSPNDALEYEVTAALTINGKEISNSIRIQQDTLDIIRQEYFDYNVSFKPDRNQVHAPSANHIFLNRGNYQNPNLIVEKDLGNLSTLFDNVKDRVNQLLNDDLQGFFDAPGHFAPIPVGTSGLASEQMVVHPGQAIPRVGPLGDTDPEGDDVCAGPLVGNRCAGAILAGPNGIAETHANNRHTMLALSGPELTSAYRNPQRNQYVGSVTFNAQNPRHMEGRALDIDLRNFPIPGKTREQLMCLVEQAGTEVVGSGGRAFAEGPSGGAVPCDFSGSEKPDHVHIQN